jgi:hypothetical protein
VSSHRNRLLSIEPAERLALLAAAVLAVWTGVARAEEGGSGHYAAGSMSSFIDAVPQAPTFMTRLNILNYKGSVGANVPLPIAGRTALGVDATSWAYGLSLVWRPAFELAPGWSYAMSATIPYVTMDVSADLLTTTSGGAQIGVGRSDKLGALGDVVLIPLMLNYNVDPDLNVNFRITGYAPTGSYQVGRLANTGKNFWTIEPTLAFVYFGQKNGREASLFIGTDFNNENSDTRYKSGTQVHVETTLAQHFPLAGGLAGAGLSAFYYQQLTGDSGEGATFGAFKARTWGFGPVLSYVTKVDGHDVISEFKWLHEQGTKNRLQGDTLWLKVVYKFY